MKSIFLTGSSGFIGEHIINHFSDSYDIVRYHREEHLDLGHDIIINLAGISHDISKIKSDEDYYNVNYKFSNWIFDQFLDSNAELFIAMSSTKAVADRINGELMESAIPSPQTSYGKSKLMAEEYILSKKIPKGKRVIILRPCMIHGSGNKGNLNLLYKIMSNGFPWPLASFENLRSYCSIGNMCFIIREIIENDKILSGVYNISDDEPLSTNQVIDIIASATNKSIQYIKVPKGFIYAIAKIGDILDLSFNSERLQKLTENYIVNNNKIKEAIGKPFPLSSREGITLTIKSFCNCDK